MPDRNSVRTPFPPPPRQNAAQPSRDPWEPPPTDHPLGGLNFDPTHLPDPLPVGDERGWPVWPFLVAGFTALVLLLLAAAGRVSAADGITMCRDGDFAWVRVRTTGLVGLEGQGVTWWYVAEGANFEGDVFVSDGETTVGVWSDELQDYVLYSSVGVPVCGALTAQVADLHLAGSPGTCYLAYLQDDEGSWRLDDREHPDGIPWRADTDGQVHVIVGAANATYQLVETPCP